MRNCKAGRGTALAWWLVLAVLLLAPWVTPAQVLPGTEIRITTNLSDQFDPAISGNIVVYTDMRGFDADVWYFDLASGTEHPVTTALGDQQLTDVSEGVVVYTDLGMMHVYAFDVATGTSTDLNAGRTSAAFDPAVGQGLVAWQDNRDGNYEIYARQLATGEERRLSSSPDRDERPAVDHGVVVWDRCDLTGFCQIFAHDWASGVTWQPTDPLTTPGRDERAPSIRNGRVVFEGTTDRGTAAAEKDIYLLDLATGVETRLSLPGNQGNPNLSGDFVSFDDMSSGLYHVRVWHVPSGLVFDLPVSPASQQFLNAIDGNRVVYTDDRNGQLDIFMYEFQVQPPIADAGPAQAIYLGETATLRGAATDPQGLAVASWRWTVTSAPPGATWTLSGDQAATALFAPGQPGDYVLSLVASNGVASSAPSSVVVQAAAWLPPVAVATADVTSGLAPLTVCFDAGGSSSPQPGALTFAWTFGDGASADTAQACHTYGLASPSPYSAAVTVTDVRGLTDTELFSITVTEPNQPPSASPTATPNRGAAPLAVQFTAGASDPDGDPLTFAWDFGDPSSPDNASALPDPAHLYRNPGTFTAWLTVSDGQVSVARSLTIAVDASISLDVRFARVKWSKRPVTGAVTVWADFKSPVPAPDDLVLVSFDGIQLLAEPFSAFELEHRNGTYHLAKRGVVAKLDFARGRLFVMTRKIGLTRLDPSNGVDVELMLGSALAVENIRMKPAGHELLLYRREGCEEDEE